MTYVQRALTITFQLQSGTFAGGAGSPGGNTLTLTNLRASARITKAGGPSMSELNLAVWGMSQSQMDQLSTLGLRVALPSSGGNTTQIVPRNTVTVGAGDAGAKPATVFYGNILEAWGDYNAQPDVAFRVVAQTLGAYAVAPQAPASPPSPVDAAAFMSGLAGPMGCTFENNGVDVKLSNPYFWGSARDQALQCVRAAGLAWNGGDNGVLAIMPRGGARATPSVPVVSPSTGMIGYPSWTAQGVDLRTVFNPSILFMGTIQLQTSLARASGTYTVAGLDYLLESQLPGGKWEAAVRAFTFGLPAPVSR